MSFKTLFERLPKTIVNYKQACYADYKSIVIAIADGEEPDHEQIMLILHANTKTTEELQDDVELLLRRRELRPQYEALPELYNQREENRQAIEAENQILQAAKEQHDKATDPYYWRLQDIGKAIKLGESAREELFQSCNDPDLRAEMDCNQAESSDSSRKSLDLQSRIRELSSQASSCRSQAQRVLDRSSKKELQDEANSLDFQRKKLEIELSKVRRREEKLEKRRQELTERMREV